MDAKTTGIVAYITWIGLVIAFVLGDREGAKFHLNQALVLTVCGVIWTIVYRVAYGIIRVISFGLLTGIMGALNALVTVVLLVLTIMGLVNAIQGEEKPLPLIGGITLLH